VFHGVQPLPAQHTAAQAPAQPQVHKACAMHCRVRKLTYLYEKMLRIVLDIARLEGAHNAHKHVGGVFRHPKERGWRATGELPTHVEH
jgi:hypothetical protein